MTSELGFSIHQLRHELTARLVQQVLGIEADDDNHALALDFCLQKAYYHRFPDTRPSEVEAFYTQMVVRLREDSQLTKAATLSALSSKLLALPLPSPCGTADLNHSLLQLLASLARRPLNSVLQETPELLQLMYQPAAGAAAAAAAAAGSAASPSRQQAAAATRFQRGLQRATAAADSGGEGSAGGDSGSECDPYSDASSLSNWGDGSDDDDEQQQQQQHLLQLEAQSESERPVSPCQQLECPPPSSRAPPPGSKPPGLLLGPPQLRPGLVDPPRHCLLPRLFDARLPQQHAGGGGGQLATLLRPKVGCCYTEAYLAQQVLAVLQGLPAQGFRLVDPLVTHTAAEGTHGSSSSSRRWQQRLEADPDVTTPHMSRSALQGLLADAAAAGSQARALRALVQQLAGGSTGAAHTTHITPCLRSFGVALQQQLDVLGMQLASLQERDVGAQRQQKQQGALLEVCRQTRPVVRRLELLHASVFGVLDTLGGPPPAVSSGLIDGLAAAVKAAAQAHSGTQGVAEAAALLHLLLSACVPLVGALAHWLWGGGDNTTQQQQQQQQAALTGASSSTSVCSPDFFILRQSAVAATHPSFWHTAYGFTTQRVSAAACSGGSSSSVSCPTFLLPLVGAIMSAGKGMRLLQHMEQEELNNSSFCSKGQPKQQQQQQQQAAGKAAGPINSSSMQRVASVGRPSSAGSGWPVGRSGSANTRMTRQPSLIGRGGHRRSSSASGAPHAVAASGTKPAGRKQWSTAVEQQQQAAPVAPVAAAAADVSRQVRMQLAAAAVVAGRQEQDVLPREFVDSACAVLRSQQQMLAHACGQQNSASRGAVSGAGDVLAARLLAAGVMLAHPSTCASQPAVGATQQQQPGCRQPGAVALRQAFAAAKVQRLVDAAKLSRQPEQDPDDADADMQQQQQECCVDGEREQPVVAGNVKPEHDSGSREGVPLTTSVMLCEVEAGAGMCDDEGAPAEPPPLTTAQVPAEAAAAADADGSPDVPRLTAVRDQLQSRLTFGRQQLHHMAPWTSRTASQHSLGADQQQHPATKHMSSSSRGRDGNLLLAGRAQQVPGRFTGSLAELWPLKRLEGLRGSAEEQAGDGVGSGGSSSSRTRSLLQAGRWPGEALSWLLDSPPQQLPALECLLDVALCQPLQRQIDIVERQLLSSLMGEWGMLQQLQALVGAFITSSPVMVEWLDACFDAVDAAAAAAAHTTATSGGSSGSPAAVAPRSSRAVAEANEQKLLAQRVDARKGLLHGLQTLLQDLIASSDGDDGLPDSSSLHVFVDDAATKQEEAGVGHSSSSTASGGLMLHAVAEWAGLRLQHSGSWQLSLLYNPEQLSSFNHAWRFMLQLRWVRRCVDRARHGACKGSAVVAQAAARDRAEAAAVAAATAAAAQAGRPHLQPGPQYGPISGSGATGGGAATASATAGLQQQQQQWLTGREELLLLQEMCGVFAGWQSYVMERLIFNAWATLEQTLLSATNLGQVQAAALTFLAVVLETCGAPVPLPAAPRTRWWVMVHRQLRFMMDDALKAAAAADSLRAARQQLAVLQAEQRQADMVGWWLQLGSARRSLSEAAQAWREHCKSLFPFLHATKGAAGAEALLSTLDMNAYLTTKARDLKA